MDFLKNVQITDISDVIIPPPDLRPIIETTAQYVAKKGIGLEKQIAQRQATNAKFDFLKAASPYNAFYRKQIAIVRQEAGITEEPATPETAPKLPPSSQPPSKDGSELKSVAPPVLTACHLPSEGLPTASLPPIPSTDGHAPSQAPSPQEDAHAHSLGQASQAPPDGHEEEKASAAPSSKAGTSVEESEKSAAGGALEEPQPKAMEKKPLLERIKDIINDETQPMDALVKENKEYNYDVKAPPDIVPLDVEIIKLTAQFVAANGRSFLATVSNREQKNPQFAFLKPTNSSLFLFFSDLVQVYQRILSPPAELFTDLSDEAKNKKLIFKKILGYAEYIRREKRREEKARKSREDEKKEMSLIDWHSFVILETIDFKEGDDEYLPPPSMTIEEINEHLEAEKRLNENIQKVGATIDDEVEKEAGESSDEDVQMMDIDEDEDAVEKMDNASQRPTLAYSVDQEKVPSLESYGQRQERIANQKQALSQKSSLMQKCTVCGQNIPVSEIEEHIRIELLDPKWSEQRKIALSKMRDSTLADPSEMERNLRNFVQVRKRPFDIDKPKEVVDESIIWEGYSNSAHVPAVAEMVAENAKRAKLDSAASSKNAPPAERKGGDSSALAAEQSAKIERITQRLREMEQGESKAAEAKKVGAQNLNSTLGLNQTTAVNHFSGQHIPIVPIAQQYNPHGPMAPQPTQPFISRMPPQIPHQMMPLPRMAQPPIMRRPISGAHEQNLNPMTLMMGQGMSMPNQSMGIDGFGANVGMSMMPARPILPSAAPAVSVPVRAVHQRGPVEKSHMTGLASLRMGVSEAEFMKTHSRNVSLKIAVPSDASQASCNFNGQTYTLNLLLTDTVAVVKNQLAKKLNGMPVKKIKLKIVGGPFLKDNLSLAYYNLTSKVPLEVGVKARGGRK